MKTNAGMPFRPLCLLFVVLCFLLASCLKEGPVETPATPPLTTTPDCGGDVILSSSDIELVQIPVQLGIDVQMSGSSVCLVDENYTNCCSELEVTFQQECRVLKIVEKDNYSSPVMCNCFTGSKVTVCLSDLSAGSYTIQLYRGSYKHLVEPFPGGEYRDQYEEHLVFEQEITI